MIQKTYKIPDEDALEKMAEDISRSPAYGTASDRAMLVFEPHMDPEMISQRLKKIHGLLPDLKVFGMTLLGPLGRDMVLPEETTCSLLLMQESYMDVQLLDCSMMRPDQAAEIYLDNIQMLRWKQAVFMVPSDTTLASEDFLAAVTKRCPELPIFGTLSGMQDITYDNSLVFAGETILHRGILTVTFCGENLHFEHIYSLGWKPLGLSHEVTEVKDEYELKTIDDQPASDLYGKYLNMGKDELTYENVCAFPLLEYRGNMTMARVPLSHGPDGAMHFSTKIRPGSKINLSYSKRDYLLEDSLEGARKISAFEPEAVIVITCLNRRTFMHNAGADRELNYFRQVLPEMTVGYGMGEIYQCGTTGGVTNSTLVAGAFREGGIREDRFAAVSDPLLENPIGRTVPLNDRLVTFLEQTTDELQKLATVDQLTGIANRRKLDEQTEVMLKKQLYRNVVSAMMFDIDHFKIVNDTYGHLTGDWVLKEVCRIVEKRIGRTDVFGRWGGEEFVCLLSDTNAQEASELAEKIRKDVAAHTFEKTGRITISIGVTEALPSDTVDTLMARLDKGLYQAKNCGRNQVVLI